MTRRMRVSHLLRSMALAIGVIFPLAGQGAESSGQVINVADGRGIAHAAVTLTLPAGFAGPTAITVFTNAEGTFHFPDDGLPAVDQLRLRAHLPGFHQVDTTNGKLKLRQQNKGAPARAVVYMQPSTNIAGEVPASAWFANMPAGDARNITLTSCSSCHQMASPKVREYAAQIEAVANGPEGDKKALEAWRKVVRHEAWRSIVKYMRPKHFAVLPLESPNNLDAVDWAAATNPDYNLFNAKQGEIVAQYLADHFPHTTEFMARDDYHYGAPIGATEKTVIREYAFPETALVREMVAAPKSRYLWGADVRRNMIVRLDPKNGKTKWYSPPYDGSTGPHTIVPDDDGKLWISMIDHNQFSRFDPKTEKWTLWTLRPSNLPETKAISGLAIVHDMSIDSRGHLAKDADGKVWLTLAGSNQLATLDPDDGRVAFYETNTIKGLSPINHLLYSVVLSADGKKAWYSQVNGSIGRMDTRTRKVDKLISFPDGTGPRRMARDNNGHLWVAMFGVGQVAKIDMVTAKVLDRYDLPDRAASPYSVTWDEHRKTVWVVNANSDVIYRLDPESGKFTVYPLPRPQAYLRQVEVSPEDGRLIASYGNYPEGSGPSMGVVIDVGD